MQEPPTLDNEDERQSFLNHLDDAIQTKQYPECDVSISENVLIAMFTREEARERGYDEYAEAVDERVQQIFAVPQQVTDAAQDGDDPSRDGDANVLAFLYSTQVWREAVGSFAERDGDIMHGGDYVNGVISAETLDDARRNLSEFRAFLYEVARDTADRVEEEAFEAEHDDMVALRDALFEPEASIHNILVYNGMLATLHRRELGHEITEEGMRVP